MAGGDDMEFVRDFRTLQRRGELLCARDVDGLVLVAVENIDGDGLWSDVNDRGGEGAKVVLLLIALAQERGGRGAERTTAVADAGDVDDREHRARLLLRGAGAFQLLEMRREADHQREVGAGA